MNGAADKQHTMDGASAQEGVTIVGHALDYWAGVMADLDGFQTFMEEHDNILRAVKMGLGAEATRRQALELALAAFLPVQNSGLWPVWIPLFEAIYGRFCDIDRTVHARFLSRLGQLYRLHNRVAEATAVHQEAAALMVPFPANSQLACEIFFQLAEDYRQQSQFNQAREYALAAWESAQAGHQSDAWRATSANSLGLIYQALDQLDEAVGWYTRAIDLWRPLQRPVELGRVLSNLGGALQGQGKLDEALLTYHQAQRQLENTPLWLEKLIVQYNIAVVYFYQESYALGEGILREAYLTIARQPDIHFILYAHICHSLGNVILQQKRYTEAESPLRESIAAWQKLGDMLNLANSLGALAKVLIGQDQFKGACDLYDHALAAVTSHRHIPRGDKLYQELCKARVALDC
jgi:tetratricopeptide (TPR) repeat protein